MPDYRGALGAFRSFVVLVVALSQLSHVRVLVLCGLSSAAPSNRSWSAGNASKAALNQFLHLALDALHCCNQVQLSRRER